MRDYIICKDEIAQSQEISENIEFLAKLRRGSIVFQECSPSKDNHHNDGIGSLYCELSEKSTGLVDRALRTYLDKKNKLGYIMRDIEWSLEAAGAQKQYPRVAYG